MTTMMTTRAPLQTGHADSLADAAAALTRYAADLQAQPDRLILWQLMNATVNAGRVAKAHARACAAPGGALAAIAESDPGRAGKVRATWDEHDQVFRRANQLIAEANQILDPSRADANRLRAATDDLCALLRLHRQHVTDLVYEAALRDVGGEG